MGCQKMISGLNGVETNSHGLILLEMMPRCSRSLSNKVLGNLGSENRSEGLDPNGICYPCVMGWGLAGPGNSSAAAVAAVAAALSAAAAVAVAVAAAAQESADAALAATPAISAAAATLAPPSRYGRRR